MRIRKSHPGVFWSTTTFVNVRSCPSGNRTRTVLLLVFIHDVPFEKTASLRAAATPAQHLHAAGVRRLGLRPLPERHARCHAGGGLGISGHVLYCALAEGGGLGMFIVAEDTDVPTLPAPASPAGRGTRGSRSFASAHAWAWAIVATRRCWAGCAPTCTVTRRCWSA